MATVTPSPDNPFSDDHSSVQVKIPSNRELYDFFNQFLGVWMKLPSQRVDKVEDDIHPLPNERGLMFTEPVKGILVLRTSEDFGKALAKLAGVKGSKSDLFVEMIVLLWHRFVSKFWGKDSRRLPPALFKRSVPAHWPNRKPDSGLMVLAMQQPIELCLWVNLTEAEMERWKGPKR